MNTTPKKPQKAAGTLAGLNLADLDTLSSWLKKSGLEEVEVESGSGDGKLRLRLKMPSLPGSGHVMAPVAAPALTAAPAPAPEAETANTFKSPMVGTFYAASGPDAAPFVQVGSVVKAGQTLCIIEAMKTMNQIVADKAGTVQQVLVKNASPVEFGQPLFVMN